MLRVVALAEMVSRLRFLLLIHSMEIRIDAPRVLRNGIVARPVLHAAMVGCANLGNGGRDVNLH